jgi:putative ABC transport system ATP-binding protein
MIAIKSVTHSYGNAHRITFKDWQINNGEQWLLLGSSGSGKTTLLHILTGILKPTDGEVVINNTPVYSLPSKKLEHRDNFSASAFNQKSNYSRKPVYGTKLCRTS